MQVEINHQTAQLTFRPRLSKVVSREYAKCKPWAANKTNSNSIQPLYASSSPLRDAPTVRDADGAAVVP